ncbi:MAG: hypothetical protein HETSPECPRED_004760 [Heterodermia speciosa]|uniref:NFACT RNA-binding domain-containing protein n=1 Tax=Heterodermia speciosa TaxID=116794 RepID=A0A8H3EKQ1_9LECA|nr:MAG: hypothetical protein HETSPECPRED_004760 [Heterodermia speciosa]
MVYYFTSNAVDPPATLYVGKDKFENEELIKYGWEEDFHVDNLSSAHVYLRLSEGQEWNKLPKALVEDCAQLTKANSIEGNKKDNVTVIYTPWSNLHKNAGMATGQVGFHDQKKVLKILIPTRINATINRLSKTRSIASTDTLATDKEAHLKRLRAAANALQQAQRKEEERVRKEQREEKWSREHAYEELHKGLGEEDEEGEGKGRSNQEVWDEDDFM